MDAAEAAAHAAALGARHVVPVHFGPVHFGPVHFGPVHFGGWRHFSEARDDAARVFAASPVADRVAWLAPGRARTFRL